MALAPVPPVVIQKKRGKGCIGCGCGVLAAIVIVLILLGIFFYHRVSAAAVTYTSATPTDVPTTDGGDATYQAVQNKLTAFEQAFQQNQPATLHLTADEINTLIARDPNYAKLHGKIHVSLMADTAELQSSLQLGMFEKAFLPDRYFNSDATLGLGFAPATHTILVDLRRLQFSGQTLPPSANTGINQSLSTVLNQQLQMNAQTKQLLDRAQKIDIENGELVIETR